MVPRRWVIDRRAGLLGPTWTQADGFRVTEKPRPDAYENLRPFVQIYPNFVGTSVFRSIAQETPLVTSSFF